MIRRRKIMCGFAVAAIGIFGAILTITLDRPSNSTLVRRPNEKVKVCVVFADGVPASFSRLQVFRANQLMRPVKQKALPGATNTPEWFTQPDDVMTRYTLLSSGATLDETSAYYIEMGSSGCALIEFTEAGRFQFGYPAYYRLPEEQNPNLEGINELNRSRDELSIVLKDDVRGVYLETDACDSDCVLTFYTTMMISHNTSKYYAPHGDIASIPSAYYYEIALGCGAKESFRIPVPIWIEKGVSIGEERFLKVRQECRRQLSSFTVDLYGEKEAHIKIDSNGISAIPTPADFFTAYRQTETSY